MDLKILSVYIYIYMCLLSSVFLVIELLRAQLFGGEKNTKSFITKYKSIAIPNDSRICSIK